MKSFKFAENLKYYRKQAGLTQSQLAAHFNSDKSLISNYENGKNVPDIFKMWELADIFDVTIDEFGRQRMTDLLYLRKNICTYRKLLNLTQEELSNKLGGSKNLVSNYENGISTPDIYTLVKLADIFDITLDELVGRE